MKRIAKMFLPSLLAVVAVCGGAANAENANRHAHSQIQQKMEIRIAVPPVTERRANVLPQRNIVQVKANAAGAMNVIAASNEQKEHPPGDVHITQCGGHSIHVYGYNPYLYMKHAEATGEVETLSRLTEAAVGHKNNQQHREQLVLIGGVLIKRSILEEAQRTRTIVLPVRGR